MCDRIKDNTTEIEFVKNSMLISHFCKILKLYGDNHLIVPLKGISLLFTIYKDDYARNVGDLDVFISKEQTDYFIRKMQEIGYTLRSEKMNYHRLEAKGKFDMVNNSTYYPDLDVHVDLITKKFFRKTVQGFTVFALCRLYKVMFHNIEISLLSPVDEWLYLAQHYCFHLFSGEKWLKDLYLLQSGFSKEQLEELRIVAGKFHFERVVTAVGYCLRYKYPAKEIKIPIIITEKNFLFNRLFRKPDIRFSRVFSDRIIAAYWEFLFIDHSISRLKAYICLLFPGYAMFNSIYTISSPVLYCLLYPLHVIIVLLSSSLFVIFASCKYSKVKH